MAQLTGTEILFVVPLRPDGTPAPILEQTTTQAIANLAAGGASEPANLFFASPASGAGIPTFRAIAKADLTAALASPPSIGTTTAGVVHATQFQIGGFDAGGAFTVSTGPAFTGLVHPQAQFGGSMSGSGASNGSSGALFLINLTSDTVTIPNGLNYFNVVPSFGGSAMTGNRTAIASFSNLTAPSGNAALGNPAIFYCSYASVMQATTGDGGTSTTKFGNFFGVNPTVRLLGGATFVNSMIAAEFDLDQRAGSSVGYRQGVKVVLGGTGGTVLVEDFAYGINSSSPMSNYLAFANGYTFGSQQGWWPIQPTGTMMGTLPSLAGGPAYACALGIDFFAVTFSTAFLKSAGFLVDGSGHVTAASINAASIGGITPAAGAFTTLAASGAVSGAGFTAWAASPPAIGATTPSTGRFTALSLTGSVAASSVLVGPSGATGAPTQRQLASADISGLGTMATQAATSVNIDGGTVDGAAIGSTTPSSGRFTTLTGGAGGLSVDATGNTTVATLVSATNNAIHLTGQTSGAGTAAGTLTNAPVAGNPAFWIPVTINGATVFIPAWS